MTLKISSDKNTKYSGMDVPGTYKFMDTKTVPDPFLKYNFKSLSDDSLENPAIVIDNGKRLILTKAPG